MRLLVALPVALAACTWYVPPRPAPAPTLELSVMSFNVRYGTANDGPNAWTERRRQLLDLLDQQSPDVIGMQEALKHQLDEVRLLLPRYGRAGVAREDGHEAGEYAAVLFRTDRFELVESGNFWFSDTPDVPGSTGWGNRVTRMCTWARLRAREGGAVITVFNVHLDHESQPSRERSVELLLERIPGIARGTPAIITGDFNAGEANPAVERLRRAGWRDAHRVLHPGDTIVGTYHGFRGDSTGEKIDYVFVPPGAAVLESRIIRSAVAGRYPSDHFPVVARIRL